MGGPQQRAIPHSGEWRRESLKRFLGTMLLEGGRLTDEAGQGALLTDGRFSGASRGAAVGHISPKASGGGPIGLVDEGDEIEIDVPNKRLRLRISDVEMARRRERWQPRPAKITTGYLAR